jgi:ABC-type uncharacterized transport system auxiliary subunit
MQILDGNTQALNDYMYSQEALEESFELSKEEKCQAIIEYAVKLLNNHTTDKEFEWTFSSLLEDGGENLWQAIEDWDFGIINIHVRNICLLALEGASEILYDTELSEIAYYNEADWTNIMLDELVGLGGN